MKILGIETSCDETAAAIVEDGTKLISNSLASSVDMHGLSGGIIPEQAAREQIKSILPVIKHTLSGAKIDHKNPAEVDAIAVTFGPGLIGSLLVGVETAKTLSLLWNKPLIPVNHLVAHLYANWINPTSVSPLPQFPAIGLVVSGGHTDLVLLKSHTNIQWIGGTRDDAAGEAFDKTARILGLGYPGGPAIAKAAEKYLRTSGLKKKLDLFPRPLIEDKSFDFSFSGLKTAVLRFAQLDHRESIFEVAANIQEAIAEVLVNKTIRAASLYKSESILIGGGVAANNRLKEVLQSEVISNHINASLHVPKPEFCTDNAASIASAAFFYQNPKPIEAINADPQLSIV